MNTPPEPGSALLEWVVIALFAVLLWSGAFIGSATAGMLFGDRTVFQRIEVSNDGRSNVSHVSVLYGTQELIPGTARRTYPAGNAALNTYSQGMDSIIPERTHVQWETEDGTSHEATIATHSLVRDFRAFYGFRFWFVDDHVDVYLIERVPNPSHYLSLKYTKVYSSH